MQHFLIILAEVEPDALGLPHGNPEQLSCDTYEVIVASSITCDQALHSSSSKADLHPGPSKPTLYSGPSKPALRLMSCLHDTKITDPCYI